MAAVTGVVGVAREGACVGATDAATGANGATLATGSCD